MSIKPAVPTKQSPTTDSSRPNRDPSGDKTETTRLELRTRHPFTRQAPGVLDAIQAPDVDAALKNLEKLVAAIAKGDRTPTEQKQAGSRSASPHAKAAHESRQAKSPQQTGPQAPALGEKLAQAAAELMSCMPRLQGAELATIADQYRKLGIFDPAVFTRIALEAAVGAGTLKMRPCDVASILRSAAHLRAEEFFSADDLQSFVRPFVSAGKSMLVQASGRNSTGSISQAESLTIGKALAMLLTKAGETPSQPTAPSQDETMPNMTALDAQDFIRHALFRPDATALAPMETISAWQSLVVTEPDASTPLAERSLQSALHAASRAPAKFSAAQQKALDLLRAALTEADFECSSITCPVNGTPISMILAIRDTMQPGAQEQKLVVHIESASVRKVSSTKGEVRPCGEERLKQESFKRFVSISGLGQEPMAIRLTAKEIDKIARASSQFELEGAKNRLCNLVARVLSSVRDERKMSA